MSTGYFIPPYRKFALPVDDRTDCERYGEHQGDQVTRDRPDGRWEEWTCCADRGYVGELADCDDCLEPGLIPDDANLPTGWVYDSNGLHCPKCYPKEWLT